MVDFTNAISYLGTVNTYGELIEGMNREFMTVLEDSKTAMRNGESADKIADNFHDIFVKYLLKSTEIQSRVKK